MEFKVNTGDEALDTTIRQWLKWDKYPPTRQEVVDLLDRKDVIELKKRFGTRIAFGTAGLRARMEAGTARINDLIVIQTAQGILTHLLAENKDCKNTGIAIGYDHRHNSKRYADLSAAIMVRAGVPVYLFSHTSPTPFVAYVIRKKNLAAGVMVTPSHNPKGDNGYKVYWGNGAQIIPPVDKGIAAAIHANLEPWQHSWDTSILTDNALVTDPYQEVFDSYMKDITSAMCLHREINAETKLKFTYTAMHGVGTPAFKAMFQHFGFKELILVKEQVEEDPEFTTVKNPNPEEGKSALNLSFKTADENGSRVILANDPDADRLAVAEKLEDGSWKVFNGNELDVHMFASAVSSKMLKHIAEKEGFIFEETLTGHKWMGNRIDALMKEGKTSLFAYEEAIGFMCCTQVLDKDGVSAGAIIGEMAAFLATENKTLVAKLDELYQKYGYHFSSNSYYLCHNPDTTKAIFERIRSMEDGSYPSQVGGVKITGLRDLTTGYDNNQPDNKAILPTSKSSHMITFNFENGCIATLRTSGTEPKIKYYSEIFGDMSVSGKSSLEVKLKSFVKTFVKELLQPELNPRRQGGLRFAILPLP
ncbi:putative phosphoglucomutase-2-like [Apostichopus japonicus]|uniref:Putative phosphoglucomutase-2-like n=1 Tax=Stichopus japonicus TaxID=307972 RepID=A0A2G8LLS8_STIJA|nr:putative phosphoglucomutase-2-like [Apostichopus japonicus]